MGTIWEQLQQLNLEVKEKDSKLEDAVKELRKNPTDTIMLGERDRLVLALEGLNARRANLEEKLPGARSEAGVMDTTVTYLQKCLAPFPAEVLLTGQGLQKYVEGDLGEGLRLPLTAWTATRLFQVHLDLQKLLVSEDDDPLAATAKILSSRVTNTIMFSDSKMSGGAEIYTTISTWFVVDQMLNIITDFIPSPALHMSRNTKDTSGATVKNCRPDFLCWVNNALLLKGEEKADRNKMQLAIAELADKMSDAWLMQLLPGHPMPCMLGFAAAGGSLQFFSIKTVNGQAVTEPISDLYDLSKPAGRAWALRATCNVYRLLAGYAASIPPVPFPVGHTSHVKDESGNTVRSITFLTGFVRKSLAKFSILHEKYASLEVLQDVYAKMKAHEGKIIQLAHDMAAPHVVDDEYVVHLAPIGVPCMGPPNSEEELKHAVHGALTGLEALHAEGFVHRDVRWANLIRLPAQHKWLLIDLEYVGKVGCKCSKPLYPLREWRDSTLEGDDTYTPYSDLDMVAGQLMTHLRFELSSDAKELRQLLEKRFLSAGDALKHKWFRGL